MTLVMTAVAAAVVVVLCDGGWPRVMDWEKTPETSKVRMVNACEVKVDHETQVKEALRSLRCYSKHSLLQWKLHECQGDMRNEVMAEAAPLVSFHTLYC